MYQAIHLIIQPHDLDRALAIAHAAGANGASIIPARGAGRHQAGKILSVPVDERMVFVLIIVPEERVETIVHNLHDELKIEEPGQGVIMVSPLCSVSGLVQS